MTKKLEDLFDLADPVEAEEFYESREKKATPVTVTEVAPLPIVEEQQIVPEEPVKNVVDMIDKVILNHEDERVLNEVKKDVNKMMRDRPLFIP